MTGRDARKAERTVFLFNGITFFCSGKMQSVFGRRGDLWSPAGKQCVHCVGTQRAPQALPLVAVSGRMQSVDRQFPANSHRLPHMSLRASAHTGVAIRTPRRKHSVHGKSSAKTYCGKGASHPLIRQNVRACGPSILPPSPAMGGRSAATRRLGASVHGKSSTNSHCGSGAS